MPRLDIDDVTDTLVGLADDLMLDAHIDPVVSTAIALRLREIRNDIGSALMPRTAALPAGVLVDERARQARQQGDALWG